MTAETQSNLAYIIPAHKADIRLLYAIKSVLEQTLDSRCIVVGSSEVCDFVTKKLTPEQQLQVSCIIAPDTDLSYQTLTNLGIETAKALDGVEWVSFLESDDKLLPNASSLLTRWRTGYPDDSAFAGLILVVEPNGDRSAENEAQAPQLKTMANEASWAAAIMEAPGVFDFNAMLRMNFIFLNGCFFKLEILDQIGILKPAMKYYYDYEFALRVVYNGFDIRAIPKATHYHFTNGEAIEQHRSLTREAQDFWGNQARKEYFFEFDREITPFIPVATETTAPA